MPAYWSMKTSWSTTVPATPREVAENLRVGLAHDQIAGVVTDTGFELTRFPSRRGRNSWRPRLSGVFVADFRGTRVDVVANIHPFVRAFTVVHSLLLFGIAWMMGTWAFSSEIPRAQVALDALLRGEPVPPP